MEYKKRCILFGILLIFLINISFISAFGSGAALGSVINIPLGNQTFPNATTSPVNNTTNSATSTTNNSSSQIKVNQTTNSNTNTQINSNNQASESSYSDTNSEETHTLDESEDLVNNKNKNNEDDNFIDTEDNSNQSVVRYKGQDIKIILFINTLCLFFALITLMDYKKSIKES